MSVSNKSEQEQIQAARAKALSVLKQDVAAVAATPEGERVLRHIMTMAGWKLMSACQNAQTGEFVESNTTYNEGRRSLWFDFRKLLSIKHVNNIEAERSNAQKS